MRKYILYIALIQALVATLGSLFFSEAMKLTPCKLCWLQRIFMYPLVFIITVGIIKKDKALYLYILPLTIVWICNNSTTISHRLYCNYNLYDNTKEIK